MNTLLMLPLVFFATTSGVLLIGCAWQRAIIRLVRDELAVARGDVRRHNDMLSAEVDLITASLGGAWDQMRRNRGVE